MSETIVRIIRGSFAGIELPDIDFKILKYREDDGNLELEPLLARHAPLGIKHIAYPSTVIFLEPMEEKNDQNEQFLDEGPSMNEEGDK